MSIGSAVARVWGRAFFDDPVMMWLVPDEALRKKALPRLFAALARHHFLAGDAVEVAARGGAVAAAALWDPPGRWKPTPRQELAMMPILLRALGREARRGMVVSDLMESSRESNVPYHLRFGFEVTGELAVCDGGPTLWRMWRAPR